MMLCVHEFKAMGSPCAFHVYHQHKNILDRAILLAQQEVLRLEQKYSRFLPSSQLSHINGNAGGNPVTVDAETAGLLNYAAMCFEHSEGLFDITSGVFRKIWDYKSNTLPSQQQISQILPAVGFDKICWDGTRITLPKNMEIDLGGVVKEYAADCARQVLIENGIKHGLVDLGGDITVVGCKPDLSPWLMGVRDPENPSEAVVTIPLMEGAIATSGYYERHMWVDGQRYCHIINPKTGWPVQYCATVSIVAERCLVSGSLATIAMLKQKTAVLWLKEQHATFFLQDMHGQTFGCFSE